MALIPPLRRLLWLMALLICVFTPAMAQSDRAPAIEKASQTIAEIRNALNEDEIEKPSVFEEQLRTLRAESRARLALIERDLSTTNAQIELLGTPPSENEPPEPEIVSEQRSQLEAARSRLNGERTRVLANIYEAGELLARLSGAQVGAFYRSLAKRGPIPADPKQWALAWDSAKDVGAQINTHFQNWRETQTEKGALARSLAVIFGALGLSLLIIGPADRWVVSAFSAILEKSKPTPSHKVAAAGVKMAARTVPGNIGGIITIEALRTQGVLTAAGEPTTRVLWIGILSILLVSGFCAGFFSPASPQWRIARIGADRARTASHLAMAIVIIFSLKMLLTAIAAAGQADTALVRLIEAISAIAIGGGLILISRRDLWRAEDSNTETAANSGWRLLRRLAMALGAGLMVAALAGYVSLADFAATRLVFLALILGLAWLLRDLMVETALGIRANFFNMRGRKDESGSDNYRFWSRLLVNSGLAMVLLPGVLVLFGMPPSTVRDLAGQILFGYNIGGVHIPPLAKLLSAIIVFVLVMAATRLIQGGVQRGPLAHSRADIGLQNSLITLIGYAGLIIALFTSISTLGFDLGNLALIAGALSVGIGFGLQSIVNNFVSGLILLFERPIKVGDWIVTPSGEGMVKKISVRSTEIETFDRASIIVPNSELISSTVTNWTHKNRIGRIRVTVGVSYKSDPEQVRDILLQCAREHPLVVAYPEPYVVWNDFGASSLDFDLRAYLNDISKGLQVRTDLRFAIFKAFAEAGIEIPFPQQDVYIKSMPAPQPEKK